MRSVHAAAGGVDIAASKKRKRGPSTEAAEDEPSLGTNQLRSLLRKGAQTLTRPEVDVTEMLNWTFEEMVERCKDKPEDPNAIGDGNEADEQKWLSSMEKVECAVFEGKKHHREIDAKVKQAEELTRAERRIGKNTTVMIDGFAINKESLQCADWEAVPTFAGKDPRLAEPVRAKKEAINNQSYCQCCWDGGNILMCSGCPRSYHYACLEPEFKAKSKGAMFYCPQHQCVECVECDAKTTDAGGLIYRCRWCERGYCEDCLDWETAKLVGESLPELEMLGFGAVDQAWYVDCPSCVRHWEVSPQDFQSIQSERSNIDREYAKFVGAVADGGAEMDTLTTTSEVATPREMVLPISNKQSAKMA